jgi:hypothetical protein
MSVPPDLWALLEEETLLMVNNYRHGHLSSCHHRASILYHPLPSPLQEGKSNLCRHDDSEKSVWFL